MESQKEFKTNCGDCSKELIVPTVTDCGLTFQTAPAKCDCGWEQPGKWLKTGFIADSPSGYCNLRNMA